MKKRHLVRIGGLFASLMVTGVLLGACASTSGTAPHDMSAGQHEAAAKAEDKLAAKDQAQLALSGVSPTGPRTTSFDTERECAGYTSQCYVGWQSTKSPTEQHRKDAEKHQKLAERHRAASQALRDAEQRFCSGISATNRDSSPFYHREDIMSVETLYEASTATSGGAVYDSPNGSRIVFRAVPGMTAEWLQRVIDCHLARNAVEGDSDPSMSFCPLGVPHVAAIVSSTRNGFAVDIRSSNPDSIKKVIRRAQALKPGSWSGASERTARKAGYAGAA